jgi:hypothetical protein
LLGVTQQGSTDNENEFHGTAMCPQGYTIISGGFDSSNLFIVRSMPVTSIDLPVRTGWQVIGIASGEVLIADLQDDPTLISWNAYSTLTVFAICAKVD